VCVSCHVQAYLKKGLLYDCERVLLFGASLIFRRGAALSIHDAEGADWYNTSSKHCLVRGFHIEVRFSSSFLSSTHP
jgi:hypothetical protein